LAVSYIPEMMRALATNIGIDYGGKDVKPSLQHLARKPRTWTEYVRATDWDTILG
jgi:hypothetical protein